MAKSVFTNYDEEEFKSVLKQTIREVLSENPTLAESEDEKPWNLKQAAEFLKMKESTLYEKTSEKTIPHGKKGKLYFFRSELEAWLREGKVKTKKELEGEAATYSIKSDKQK